MIYNIPETDGYSKILADEEVKDLADIKLSILNL